jgi:ribonuclease BN (tRNA processing enzyme)
LSHLHADHIGGLEEMGFSGLFAWGRKVDLYLPKPLLQYLWPNSLSGGMGQRLKNGEGEFTEAQITTYFNVHPIGQSNRLSIGSIEITAFRTPHIPGRPSWGFFMHDTVTGGKVMFTCDSQLSKKNLEKFGQGADVVFHDCQLNGAGEGIHTGLEELVKLPEEMRKNILLTHYGDDWEKFLGKTGGMEFAKQDRVYKF